MPQFVAFMRAVNVSGRFVKMATLAAHYRTLGYTDVATFINSGNVVFGAKGRIAATIEAAVESKLEPLLGFRSEIFIRDPGQICAVAARAAAYAGESSKHQETNVAFLKAPLNAARQRLLGTLQTEVDTIAYSGREVYWLCKVKQSESRFSNAVLERKLQLRTTFRRLSMLEQLAMQFPGAAGG